MGAHEIGLCMWLMCQINVMEGFELPVRGGLLVALSYAQSQSSLVSNSRKNNNNNELFMRFCLVGLAKV